MFPLTVKNAPTKVALAALIVLSISPLVAETRSLRLVSAPDLINADVEYNAARCFDMDEDDPSYAARRQVIWDARATAGQRLVPGYPEAHSDPPHPHDVNQDGVLSIQEGYRGGMQDMLEHIAAEQPDAFLASGDLIDGEWATQPGKLFTSSTLPVRKQHIRDQGDIYYDAYINNFSDAGFNGPILAVIGDHEIGDNNWGPDKAQLVQTFIDVYQEKLQLPTSTTGGAYVDTPTGRDGRWWAKKMANVLLMGIETFDVRYDSNGDISAIVPDSYGSKRTLIPQEQLDWIEATLITANADPEIDHIIVMGHSPFDVSGVRTASSSNLRIGGGTSSDLWQIFEEQNVDLYLAGEVHAVSGFKENGVTQIVTSGNQFSAAASNYLVIDVYSDRLLLTLKEAHKFVLGNRSDSGDPINDDNSKTAGWRSRHGYRVVGSATLYTGGSTPVLVNQTGQLDSFVVDNDEPSDPLTIPPLVISPEAEPDSFDSPLARPEKVGRVASAGLGVESGAYRPHPGVAMTIQPACDSVLVVTLSTRWGTEFAPDPVLVDGEFFSLTRLVHNKAGNATTAVYAVELGDVESEQNVSVGGTLWRSDNSEPRTQLHMLSAVQLEGATLAGADTSSSQGTTSPLSHSFVGKDQGSFLVLAGAYNEDGVNVQLSAGVDESRTSGSYFGGSGPFDGSTTGTFSWGSGDSPRGASLAAATINPIPKLQLEPEVDGSGVSLSWHSATGSSTVVEVSTDLKEWNPSVDPPVLSGENYFLSLPFVPGNTRTFYRIRTE